MEQSVPTSNRITRLVYQILSKPRLFYGLIFVALSFFFLVSNLFIVRSYQKSLLEEQVRLLVKSNFEKFNRADYRDFVESIAIQSELRSIQLRSNDINLTLGEVSKFNDFCAKVDMQSQGSNPIQLQVCKKLDLSNTFIGIVVVFSLVLFLLSYGFFRKIELALITKIEDLFKVNQRFSLPRNKNSGVISFIDKMKQFREAYIKSQQYEDLLKIQNSKNEIYRQVSHDLMSPLQALKYLRSSYSGKDQDVFDQVIERMSFMIKDTLSGNQSNDQLGLTHILQTAVEIKKITVDGSIQVQSHIGDELNAVYWKISDSMALSNILSNLIQNSFDSLLHSKISNPSVEVSISGVSDQLVISVTDNGNGVSDNDLLKLGKFEFTTKSEGNGIGLSSAYKTIQEWGGVMSFQNLNNQNLDNRGFKVSVECPLNIRRRKGEP